MQKIAVLSKEKVEEFRIYYERKQSIDDLCMTLACDNEVFKENENLFYERLIQDNSECLKFLKQFWENCQKDYKIGLQPDEEMYIDFLSNELGVRKIRTINVLQTEETK